MVPSTLKVLSVSSRTWPKPIELGLTRVGVLRSREASAVRSAAIRLHPPRRAAEPWHLSLASWACAPCGRRKRSPARRPRSHPALRRQIGVVIGSLCRARPASMCRRRAARQPAERMPRDRHDRERRERKESQQESADRTDPAVQVVRHHPGPNPVSRAGSVGPSKSRGVTWVTIPTRNGTTTLNPTTRTATRFMSSRGSRSNPASPMPRPSSGNPSAPIPRNVHSECPTQLPERSGDRRQAAE